MNDHWLSVKKELEKENYDEEKEEMEEIEQLKERKEEKNEKLVMMNHCW